MVIQKGKKMNILCLYHASCTDGLGAAHAVREYLREQGKLNTAEFKTVQYGDPAPDVTGLDVYIVDFSFPRDVLLEMHEKAKSIVLIDHHITAKQELSPIIDAINAKGVPLSNGEVAFVDKDDYEKVKEYSWSRAKNGGAITYIGGGRIDPKYVYMHRLIMDAPDGILVDHRNRDTLDNRKINLRFANRQQNAANMDRGSKWKGITEFRGKWKAQIMIDGKHKHLGIFEAPEDAAKAYDVAALDYFGEFALLNFEQTPLPLSPNKVQNNLKIIFDMDKAGCILTWEYLFPKTPPPELFFYLQDRDLWQWKLPQSQEVSAALRSHKPFFDVWDKFMTAAGVKKLKAEGVAIVRYQQQQIEMSLSHKVEKVEIGGYTVPCVNCTHLISELGNELAKGQPFAALYFDTGDGKRVFSLRSTDEGVDVAEIAKMYGGGGHRIAAGFTVEKPVVLT